MLGCFSVVKAQDIKSKKGENYLPEAGDWAISFGTDGVFRYLGNAFNGKLDNSAPSLSSPQTGSFVGKKFITDKMAYRVIANVGFAQGKLNGSSETNLVITDSDIEVQSFNLQLGVGKEWRKGKTRLQGFYGSDIFVSLSSNSYVVNEGFQQSVIKQGLSYGVGINGFIGAEYFIFPKMSLGAQYSLGLGFNKIGKLQIKQEDEIQGAIISVSNFYLGQNFGRDPLGIIAAGIEGFNGISVGSINLTLHF